jgi:hypothetical protein
MPNSKQLRTETGVVAVDCSGFVLEARAALERTSGRIRDDDYEDVLIVQYGFEKK